MNSHETLLEFLRSLEDETFGETKTSPRGAKAIGTYDDGSALPFQHIFFAPLDAAHKESIENRHGRKIPDEYFSFLIHHNGGRLFRKRLVLMGYPVFGDTFGQPIDFVFEDVYSRPPNIPDHWFAIGGYATSDSNNSLLMAAKDGRIYLLIDNSPVNSWANLAACLQELKSNLLRDG